MEGEGSEEGGRRGSGRIKVVVRELEGRKLGGGRREVGDVGGSREEEGWRVKKEGEREGGTEGRREVRREGGKEGGNPNEAG